MQMFHVILLHKYNVEQIVYMLTVVMILSELHLNRMLLLAINKLLA